MSRSRQRLVPTLAALLALVALTWGGPAVASPVATLEIDASHLSWSVVDTSTAHYLRVEGPSGRIERLFEVGEIPSLGLGGEGAPLLDGLYSWELKTWGTPRERGATPAPSQPADPRLALGHFTVDGGLFVVPQVEPEVASRANSSSGQGTLSDGGTVSNGGTVATRDILYIDDVIIDSNACVGTGCVNGESFGTDVLRLKDVNNRIHFQDVSTGTYPTNDWRLTVNSDIPSSASFFSIDDIDGSTTPFTIEAGARSTAIYVESTGDVGFGTSTPITGLHLVRGDSPTLRLEQDGSGDFAPHTWDITGNETNFFIKDVSSGSNLPFRIRPEAPTNALYIEEDGKIGLGTDNPGTALHVRRTDGTANLLVQEASATVATRSLFEIRNPGSTQFTINNTNAGVVWRMANNGRFTLSADGTGAFEFDLQTSGDLEIRGTLTEMSDVAAKREVVPVDPQAVLAAVEALPISTWSYLDNPPELRHMGPMAQDFYSAFELGGTSTGISPRNLAAVALASIQGLTAEKDAEIAQLRSENDRLTERLERLETLVESLRESNP